MPEQSKNFEASALPRPELFIGLVAAIGTDHSQLCQMIEESLRTFGYKTRFVRLASLLRSIPQFKGLPTEPLDAYISEHQRAGNRFRELVENENAMAALGIKSIWEFRAAETGNNREIAHGTAYVIRSLKTPEEVQLLRDIYGDAFFLIASSASYQFRRNYLAHKIAQSHHEFHPEPFLAKSEELIQRDLEEAEKHWISSAMRSGQSI